MDEKELEALKAANPKAYEFIVGQKSELEKLKAAPPKKDDVPPKKTDDDPDLQEKARLERETREKGSAREKQLESALKFSMRSAEFLKQNDALLPKDMADIFKAAEKENFDDAIQKDAAIKTGMIQSFFAVQANVDLLTAGQKAQLDDYLKLTKTGKQDKAQYIYDMIFEPAFDALKRQKKAEALGRGHASGDDVQDSYKKRLMSGSAKHYLGEKANVT